MLKQELIDTLIPMLRERHGAAIVQYLDGCTDHAQATMIMRAIGADLTYNALGALLKSMVDDEEIRKDPNGKYYIDRPFLPWKTGLPRSRAKARKVAFPDDWAPQKGDPVRGGYAPFQRASIDAL